MPPSSLATIVGRLVHRLPPSDGTSDDALLARFAGWRDEAAFELLVYRHGPMVRGLCRRILRHEQDAEDAFQATFLTLARKAGGLRGRSLAGWLHRVALHAALKARARSARRETPLPEIDSPAVAARDHVLDGELRAVLDEEILRLPERFRLAVVLCYLQGRSTREAAVALGVPKGTVDSRLSTARQRLRVRLLRRGFAPAVAAAAVEGTLDAGELSGTVVRAVTKAAVVFLSNQAGVPAAAAVLAEGVLQTMSLTKLKWAMAAAVTVALLGSGAGVATFGGMPSDEPSAAAEKQKPNPKPDAPAKPIVQKVVDLAKLAPDRFAQMCEALQQPVMLEKAVEGSPIKDVTEFLSDKYGVTFIYDTKAFEQAGVGGGRNVQDTQVNLPRMPGVTLATVLRFLTAQVDGSILIRRDYFEITTRERAAVEAFGPRAREMSDLVPTVNVVFSDEPLRKALAELAGQSGKNVVLDPRVQDKDGFAASARLLNTPIDTAVLVVANMAGLQSVALDNVYYVTTRENAEQLQMQQTRPRRTVTPPAAKPTEPKARQ